MFANFFIFTAEERLAAMAFNNEDEGLTINPVPISGETPGTGSNINGLAANYAVDDIVELSGCFVVGYEMLTDPEYLRVVPNMIAYVLTMPLANLDTDVIFAPFEDE